MQTAYTLENWIKENKHGYWQEVGTSRSPLRKILMSAVAKTQRDGVARRIVDFEGKLAAVKLGHDGLMVVILSLKGINILTRSYYRAGTRKGRYSSVEQESED